MSYLIQAVLIGLFGLYLLPGVSKIGLWLGIQYPEKIHRRFRAVNLLVAASFFAAEVLHLTQNPGIVERDFMRMLADLQCVTNRL